MGDVSGEPGGRLDITVRLVVTGPGAPRRVVAPGSNPIAISLSDQVELAVDNRSPSVAYVAVSVIGANGSRVITRYVRPVAPFGRLSVGRHEGLVLFGSDRAIVVVVAGDEGTVEKLARRSLEGTIVGGTLLFFTIDVRARDQVSLPSDAADGGPLAQPAPTSIAHGDAESGFDRPMAAPAMEPSAAPAPPPPPAAATARLPSPPPASRGGRSVREVLGRLSLRRGRLATPEVHDRGARAKPPGAPAPEPRTAGEDGPPITPTPPAADVPAATRTAYGRLEAPDAVVSESEFKVVVGIAAEQSQGVTGPAMTIPDPSDGDFVLTVLLVADGCRLRDGGAWRNDLLVTASDPFPALTLHLTSEAFAAGIGARTLQAVFSVAGTSVGVVVRSVAVVSTVEMLAGASAATDKEVVALAMPTGQPRADLEIRILTDANRPIGTLLWDVDSPHEGVPRPAQPIATSIGSEPRDFATRVIADVDGAEGTPALMATLRGFGDAIAEEIPTGILDALYAVGDIVTGRVPSVLILSAEAYVPWELAVLDKPLNKAAPPFLGAQVILGRWVLGNRKPVLPPPPALQIATMVIVSGVYDSPDFERLEQAEQEAEQLATEYLGASKVNADQLSVLGAVAGIPPAQVLHFAVHGKYDPGGSDDGVALVDDTFLTPVMVRGTPMKETPFVFLNACQVGSGNTVLGDYAGMAAAFLHAGASGVVAPLWSIDDTLAREVAVRLYQTVFSGVPVGEAVRRERANLTAAGTPTSATLLAYQFFGHPNLMLTRATEGSTHG